MLEAASVKHERELMKALHPMPIAMLLLLAESSSSLC